MTLFRAALDGLVPYEPGKPEEEVQRELGLDRVVKLASNEGPWGPFPAALEAMERCAGAAQPLSRRRRLPPPPRARRAARRRSGERGHGCGRGRGDRPPLGRDARSGRRGRHRVAVLHQLRARHAQARRRAAEGAARRRSLRPRRAPGRDRPAHQARLRRDAEQPDRDDDDPRAARRLLRARPRARADGARPGLLRVHRAPGLPRRRRRVRCRPAGGSSSCARSRRSTASRASASATASGRST